MSYFRLYTQHENIKIKIYRGGLEAMSRGGANFARSAKKFFLPPPRIFLPPPRQNSRGGQNNSRGGQIIFHSFTEETLDQGGKFMSLFPQNHVKIA